MLENIILELGLVQRETPFGSSSASAKRSLYKIADPFCRMWFRVVAPNRGLLANAPRPVRERFWREARPGLASVAWEELCRQWVSFGPIQHHVLRESGDWEPAHRFWHGKNPEWDVVSQTVDGGRVLLGEVKWSERPMDNPRLRTMARKLLAKGIPPIKGLGEKEIHHVLFVPEVTGATPGEIDGVHVVTGEHVLGEKR